MDTDLALWSLAVTALSLLGFWKRPQSLYEMLMPRFVVPITIWLSTVMNALGGNTLNLPVVVRAYDKYAAAAMMYVALSLVAFWIGYLLPIGRGVGNKAPYLPVDLRRHSTIFLIGSFVLLALQQIGPHLIQLIPALAGVFTILIRVGSFGSAALLGLYLGSRSKLNVLHYFVSALVLIIAMWPLMDRFSRGAGLPVFIAVIAFSYMRRRVSFFPVLLAVLVTGYCGVQGLRGRGVHGHYAGVARYVEFLVGSPPPLDALARGTQLVHDSVAPTAVGILAREQPASYTRTIGVGAWFMNCIPVPRAFGLPHFTTHFGSYISGRKVSWGYTASMIGDTRHHLGLWGALMFLFVGVYYRAIECSSFRKFGGAEFTSEWYSFLCIISYYALILGLYNTYRAWFTLCVFGVYCIIVLILLKAFFGAPSQPPAPMVRVAGSPRPYAHP